MQSQIETKSISSMKMINWKEELPPDIIIVPKERN